MAQFQLAQILIVDPVDVAFAADDDLIIYWDDVAEDFALTLNGVSFSTSGSLLGEIDVNYRIIIGVSSTENDYAIAGYSFCNGAHLNWFRMPIFYPEYPFFETQVTADSPVCDTGGGVVCDIHFNGPPVITHSSDKSTGGSITVSATSSNGTVRYSLRNDSYANMTNTTGAFTGVIPGNWTVYAKDENDCTASVRFKILFKPSEAEHYRFTWASMQIQSGTSRDARVRIYEREYVGTVVEVDYADVSPFNLLKPKQGDINDKFFPLHPTSAVLRLKSQQDYQFLPLFTQDNKKYRVVYEVDEGSGFTEVWQGFIVPSVYRENFIATPYTVEIQIADNVKTLEQEPFTDDNGNLLFGSLKLIKVIAFIMKKTGLSLKIRSGINIFEANHNTAATDDPLDQTYIDVACYREGTEPFDCWRVLESILRPFGARILQYDNQWIIEEIDRAVTTYAYRVFTSDGVYESNSTFDPIIDVKQPSLTDRAALIEQDHSLEVIPAYGKIDIISKLNYIGSIVSGGFEKEDLLSPESEEFVNHQGVFKSEEGFRDWTLRQPTGVGGVSFGRIVVGRRGDSSRTGLSDEDDLTRSVGAFYYPPLGWSGNLRNAYIESASKPYQYGPGDEFNFRFEYSTPAKSAYPFLVLRFVIKLGTDYLQPDLSWDSTEHIFRAYPQVSNSLQNFNLSVPLPSTSVIVDTTVQVRIYFYASEFYDFGLPPSEADADGSDGQLDLKALATVGIDYDYNLDFRFHKTTGSVTNYSRAFAQLEYSTADEDIPSGIIHPDDFNATTNPKIWRGVGNILENNTINVRTRGLDRKFYIDNVSLDALINGQPPPEEDPISLTVSKYINENFAVELYNFDVPDIVNAKNMYNNYFRLSDGTPTSAWTRTGIAEALPIQQILLKVLGSNHSAPTFRLTGSFINEFRRIGINNYIRITKEGSSLTASNTEFDTNLTGWTQSSLPLGSGDWTWTADNGGSAEVTLSTAEDSKKIYQDISHSGGYIEFTVNINAVPSAGSTREDVLWVLLYKDGSIVHMEKLKTFSGISSESLSEFTYTAFAPSQVDRIGFYMKYVSGSGTCTYQVGEFTPEGKDIQEVYQIADYAQEERPNRYNFELMQISKTYISLAGIDTGGNNQGGSTTGREHSSAYSSAYS